MSVKVTKSLALKLPIFFFSNPTKKTAQNHFTKNKNNKQAKKSQTQLFLNYLKKYHSIILKN